MADLNELLMQLGIIPSDKVQQVNVEFKVKCDLPLYDYQIEGRDFCLNKKRCILSDEMGLGKTLQTLAAQQQYELEAGGIVGHMPTLIISPKSAKPVWRAEIKKWLKSESVTIVDSINGWLDCAAKLMDPKTQYTICNFETFRGFAEQVMCYPWKFIIVDEAHKFRNSGTKLNKAARKVFNHFKYTPCIFCTGTPLINTPEDLWSLLNLLYPERFSSKEAWLMSWFWIDNYGGAKSYTHKAEIAFQKHISEFMIRRLRKDVIELPEINYVEVPIELEGKQRKYYEDMRDAWLASFGEEESVLVTVIIAQIMRLRQICLSPELLMPSVNNIDGAKLEVLLDILEEATGKTVIVSSFSSYLRPLKKILESKGYTVGIIDGSVNEKVREVDVKRFQDSNDPLSIFLLASKAGGESITLTTAENYIQLDKPWTDAEEQQAFARVYRIGQNKQVNRYYLKAVDTVEQYIEEVIDRKRDMFSASIPVSLIRRMLKGD